MSNRKPLRIDQFVFWFVVACVCALEIHECRGADFDATDKVLFSSFVALEVVDVAQTWQVHEHPDEWRETNPLYGSDPNMAVVIGVKALTVVGIYYLAAEMPSVPRKILLGVVNVMQFSIDEHNHSVGIRIGMGL